MTAEEANAALIKDEGSNNIKAPNDNIIPADLAPDPPPMTSITSPLDVIVPAKEDNASDLAAKLDVVLNELKNSRREITTMQAVMLRNFKSSRNDVKQVQEELRQVKETYAQLLEKVGADCKLVSF